MLAAALAAYVMVKFYGVIFLGQPREANLADAHDAGWPSASRWSGSPPAACCSASSRCTVIAALDPVNAHAARLDGASRSVTGNWLLLAPISADRASYSPLIVLAVIVVVVLLTMQVVHRLYHGRVRRAPPWDCGFPAQTPRMQDTAEGFGQPIRQIFEPFFRIERHLPDAVRPAPALLGQGRATTSGTGCTCRSRARPSSRPGWSAGSSRAASRST